MPPLKPSRPQKRWLYSGRWTKTHDEVFINMLHFQAQRGRKQTNPSKINKVALDFAAGAVSRGLNWSFQAKTYLWRLERLRTRYLTFKALLQTDGFTWDKEKKRLNATKDAWENILQELPFADAYIEKDKPQWEKLKNIFEAERDDDDPIETFYISNGSETDTSSDGETSGSYSDGVMEIVDIISTDSE